jgi:hypothetical protein
LRRSSCSRRPARRWRSSTFGATTSSLVVDAVLVSMALTLRRRRLNAARTTPLVFEDQLPMEVNPLRLSGD